MHFKFLSEVGEHYANETTVHLEGSGPAKVGGEVAEGPPQALRMSALRSLAAGVLKAKTNYQRLTNDYTGTHGKNVSAGIQAKAAALLQASGGTLRHTQGSPPASAVTAQMIADARAEYEKQLRHFQNQGGVLKRDGTLDWGASDQVVVYDRNAAAQDLTRLRIRGGLLYTDDAGQTPFDTANLSTFFSKLGYAIYVMSEEGNIHAANHAIGYRHHSTLLGAANTAAAGEMKVDRGALTWISNKSGHYTPGVQHFVQVLHILQKRGVNLAAVRVQFHTRLGKTDYATVGDFISQLMPEEDYYHAKMIAYINSYPIQRITLLIQGNGWRFPTYDEYYRQNQKALIDVKTGQTVSHQAACRFFKDMRLTCNPVVQVGIGR